MKKAKLLTNRIKTLTPNQLLYYQAIVDHISVFHSFPTALQLAKELEVTNNAAFEMMQRLAKKKFLDKWAPGKYRLSGVIFKPKFIEAGRGNL